MNTPRFFFHNDGLADKILRATTHLKVEVYRGLDGKTRVSFEVLGSLTPTRFDEDDDEDDSDLLTKDDRDRDRQEQEARAIDLAGELVRVFAAGGKGGAS